MGCGGGGETLPVGVAGLMPLALSSASEANFKSYFPSAPIRYELDPPWSHVTSIQPGHRNHQPSLANSINSQVLLPTVLHFMQRRLPEGEMRRKIFTSLAVIASFGVQLFFNLLSKIKAMVLVFIYTLSLVCIVSIAVYKKQKALSKTLFTFKKIHNVIFFSDFKNV